MKNDYYVYLHKTLDGEVFYVGKGRGKRAKTKHGRKICFYPLQVELSVIC